nr:hypothetical protein [uncultured Mucilaginibacter sp.]
MARRKFRKVYVICQDNKIFGDVNFAMVNMYRERKYAEGVCKHHNESAVHESHKMYNQGKKIINHTVHAFYLVHESYFDEKE